MTRGRKLRGTAALSTLAVATAYAISRWPTMTNWGATPSEVAERLPGDEIVGTARYRTTHAVTIDAPREVVWSWLIQLGQGRGGMYSYDWLENLLGLHMHSAQEIRPELQRLAVGDVISMVPEGTQPSLRFLVARLDPPDVLVLGPPASREEALETGLPYPCWTFRLTRSAQGGTRLLVRFQSDFPPTPLGLLMNKYALAPVHFIMERKMLLTLKERSERGGPPTRPA